MKVKENLFQTKSNDTKGLWASPYWAQQNGEIGEPFALAVG